LSDNLEEICSESSLSTNNAETQLKKDIAAEYLKVAFNVALFYPRIVAERESSASGRGKEGNGHGKDGAPSASHKGKG